MRWLKAQSVNGYFVWCNKSPTHEMCVAARHALASCLFGWTYYSMLVGSLFWDTSSPPGEMHPWPNIQNESYWAWMNKVGQEKGSSLLALFSRKMKHYTISAIHSIFYWCRLIKAFAFEVIRKKASGCLSSAVIFRVCGLGWQKSFCTDLAKLPQTRNEDIF